MTNEERLAALAKARAVRAAKIAAKKAAEAAAQEPQPEAATPQREAQVAAKVADVEGESYVLALEACLRGFLDATVVRLAAGNRVMTDRCSVCEDRMIPGRANECPCQTARRLLADRDSAAA